jgi:hypothetical protein
MSTSISLYPSYQTTDFSGRCAPALCSRTDRTDSSAETFGGKWEPQAGSSYDHGHNQRCHCHAQHIHRGSISGGTSLEPAQKLDPVLSTNEIPTASKPHKANVANKLDPRKDPDLDDCGAAGRGGALTRHGTEPLIQLNYGSESRTVHNTGSDDELDRRAKEATVRQDEPRSTMNPYQSDFLNLLDLRVDCNEAKQMQSSES